MKSKSLLDDAISCVGKTHMRLVRLGTIHTTGARLCVSSPDQRQLFREAVLEAEALVATLKKIAAAEY